MQCGNPLHVPARGRKPRYCSRSCQARAYRSRLAERGDRSASHEADGGPARRSEAAKNGGSSTPAERSNTGLSLAQIIRTAIQIADNESLETMSMRHVANVLGVGPMSLYHYITGRDELVDLMVDAVFNDAELPQPTGEWKADLAMMARWEWELHSRHPWVLQVIATVQPPLVPNLLDHFERTMSALDPLGVDPVTAHLISLSLSGLVQGMSLLKLSELRTERHNHTASTNWRTVTAPAALNAIGAERYPRLSMLRGHQDSAGDLHEVFTNCLYNYLDGLSLTFERDGLLPPSDTGPTDLGAGEKVGRGPAEA
ncbi:AcrR family transcriptional regulator [Murinocardiopsis flavida]|uniref:AcrR family transcriptional regulator n=2 Tax=Murinocardiopsis flavida TaxID=645275 RepID=A0A2P8DTI8_9ACTN|nr:AcrR family transcriptional regulator [Murinocardiopsis flavida]